MKAFVQKLVWNIVKDEIEYLSFLGYNKRR
jgi:hypothetical protein